MSYHGFGYSSNNGDPRYYNYAQTVSDPGYDYKKLSEKIFDWQWKVTMRRKWTYSDADYEIYGITVTGDREQDFESMEDWVNTTRTIANMVELHAESKEFIIQRKQDIDRIFEIIQEYTSYIGYRFSSQLNLLHYELQHNPEVREILDDLVKLQNLGNRLFPIMVHLNQDDPVPVTGILGFLYNDTQEYGLSKFQFDPLTKYGLTLADIKREENIDKSTGLYNAVNVSQYFDPQAYGKIKGWL